MTFWTAVVILGAATGALPSSPADELAASARQVTAPITEVTVYGDRARIVRRGQLDLVAGVNVVALPDLPGGTWIDTVRVDAGEVKILRVETAPVERLRSGVERAEEILTAIEALDARLATIASEGAALEQELAFLARLTPAPLPADVEAPRILAPSIWPNVLDFLDARRSAARTRTRELAVDRRKVAEDRAAAAARLQELNLGGMTQRNIEVLAVLEARAARRRVPITLEYVVPGAGWTPTHELHFSPQSAEVTLAMYAQVRQASGEDWRGAKLSLSTAMPARGLEMPTLLTWALGEARDFVPVPRPKTTVPQPPFHPLPGPRARPMDVEAQLRLAAVQQRLSGAPSDVMRAEAVAVGSTGGMARGGYLAGEDKAMEARDQAVMMDEAEYDYPMAVAESAPPSRPRSRMPSAPRAPPPSAQSANEYAFDSSDLSSGVQGFTLGDPSERRRPPAPPHGSPAALAGGLDFVYPVAAPADIPGTGELHRVPLFHETFAADLFYETSPGLMETAFFKATVRNTGLRPILGGSSALFVAGSYAGDARIETIGPGGTVELPLGADEDVRIKRVVVPETITSGLLRREEATLYRHRIEIANYKSRPIRIRVTDQIPKTNNERITIELQSVTPPAAEGPTETEGVVHWEIELAPGASTTLELSYRIRRPVDWRLFQR